MKCEEVKLHMQVGQRDPNYEGDEDEPPEALKV